MDCRDCEKLLPLYHDGELDRNDRARVDAHVESCAGCRDALAFYAELETSLGERRALRPPAGRTAVRVIDHFGLRPRRSLFGSLAGVPGMISGALILVGVLLLLIKNPFTEVPALFTRIGDGFSFGLSPRLASWANEISQLSGTGEWMLISLYIGVFALIMLAGSWMVLRFVRE
jgi:predicted anti-sigma-YlaC factor YlaD